MRDEATLPCAGGREAGSVLAIPLAGWKAILVRTWQAIGEDNVSLIAGGATFFLILAVFPALTAFVALYGLVADVGTVDGHMGLLAGVMPQSGIDIVSGELKRLASQPQGQLGVGFAIGLGVALWSANAGVKALFSALNIAYNESEKRGFVRLTLTSFAFTIAGIFGAVALLAATVVVPAVLGYVGLGSAAATLISVLRWPILLLVLVVGIGLLFKYGASRRPPRWRWISWGTLATAVMWIAVSAAFSFYLAHFADYNATYGSLGAIIGFMMWLYVSLVILLAGAELNAEIEHQVATDTTVGPDRPMGKRRAVKADTLPQGEGC
ncbi:YihY/virulence factor BrkB family protein [Acuticoccus mangrovi]|uniref:YihY/virulence factor BrkB family protein n=1 Tax=Acuticoccus mangrovi TaxID=2796142 RepID=A0A934MHZ6_9HYPH|nr:YihY/virulence factor BrkB family protein [Acuticoccus mangrovi]MBJ3777415.1 YihY/virulence factor BrkB family protein [Acuticoccus mangrovi]